MAKTKKGIRNGKCHWNCSLAYLFNKVNCSLMIHCTCRGEPATSYFYNAQAVTNNSNYNNNWSHLNRLSFQEHDHNHVIITNHYYNLTTPSLPTFHALSLVASLFDLTTRCREWQLFATGVYRFSSFLTHHAMCENEKNDVCRCVRKKMKRYNPVSGKL